jgi:hypothetical protein
MNPKERQIVSELVSACEAVVNNWEHGDLAHAAHLCDEAAAFGQEMLEDDTLMKVSAQTAGEHAVGIGADQATLEFGRHVLHDDEDGSLRRRLRDVFATLAYELFDAYPRGVWFDDECPDCQGRLVQGRCTNGNCGSSRAQEGV